MLSEHQHHRTYNLCHRICVCVFAATLKLQNLIPKLFWNDQWFVLCHFKVHIKHVFWGSMFSSGSRLCTLHQRKSNLGWKYSGKYGIGFDPDCSPRERERVSEWMETLFGDNRLNLFSVLSFALFLSLHRHNFRLKQATELQRCSIQNN